ncbi:hypothetical protein ACPJXG_22775 [Janthinobacterium sp. NFX145]|uniref:hypothetical protein n=1 Tax=Janthinobacterium sp. NFX145 TaxID=3415602 RepID=UPI003CC6CE67
MSQKQTKFSDGIIVAESIKSDNPNSLWRGSFDFGLVGTSWDARCTAILGCDSIHFKSSILIKPLTTTSSPVLENNHSKVHNFLNSASGLCTVLEADTERLSDVYERIRSLFWAAIGEQERTFPASIFIDVSTCPRYFSLALLGEAFRSGQVDQICLGYSEGKYPDAKPSYNDLEEISFSDGAFQSIPVPGYYGEFEPSKEKLFFVSLGFDGWKTLNLLIRKEPERVVALLASPGGHTGYVERAMLANAALIERFRIPDEFILKATSGDAVEAWQRMTEAGVEKFNDENVYYLCSGNKPHSIAFALRAISLETPTLLYNSPVKYLPVEIDCNGTYWMYSIRPASGTVFG